MLGRTLDDGKAVIVDLEETSYINGTGLNMLVRVRERSAAGNTRMILVFTSSHLWRIFSVLSLQTMFHYMGDN